MPSSSRSPDLARSDDHDIECDRQRLECEAVQKDLSYFRSLISAVGDLLGGLD